MNYEAAQFSAFFCIFLTIFELFLQIFEFFWSFFVNFCAFLRIFSLPILPNRYNPTP